MTTMGDTGAARYRLELSHGERGVSGWVERIGEAPVPFSSWLELLALLESPAPATTAHCGVGPGESD